MSQPFCVSLRVRFHLGGATETFHHQSSPAMVLSTQHGSYSFSPHREERLVQCFRTQPLTPIKEVTIETGQSACDRPNSGAGRTVWNPIAALASISKVIHSFRRRPLLSTITNKNSRARRNPRKHKDKKAERARSTPPELAKGLRLIPPAVNVHNLTRQLI